MKKNERKQDLPRKSREKRKVGTRGGEKEGKKEKRLRIYHGKVGTRGGEKSGKEEEKWRKRN